MRALTNNTLIAISKHTNKVLKMAAYMAQSEQPMLLDNVYMIDNNTPQKDALELFQKDFDKTVDLIEKSHQLLSTVRGDHIVEQLDNNNKDIRSIFSDKYEPVGFVLNLPSISIRLRNSLDKESIRDSVCRTVLDIDYKTFKDFLKNCDKIYKLDEYSIETEEDAVEYLASIAYREKYDDIVNRIKEIAGEFAEYRQTLGLANRNLIDNEITFTRSMIDSVMKNSTYITKDNVEQLASSHKKNMGDVQKLYTFVKNNKFINAIELDPDTNLKGVIDILHKTSDLNLNINEQFCLKCRKLGNYNASGLYLPRQHIAAVDITNPSALIHELTHTADISNLELYNHKLREELINKVKKRIDITDLTISTKINYYLNSDEIIARLGEIAYILNKNDYKGENFTQFVEKVKLQEKEYNSEFLNIASPINDYLKQSNIYFNFDKMLPNDLLEIKEYFKSYFGVNNDDIKPIYSKAIDYEFKPTKKAKRSVNEYKDSPFVKLDPLSVVKALDYNLEKNIIPFDNLFAAVAEHISMIARRKKGMSPDDFDKQMDTTKKIYNWVNDSGNKDIQVALIKNMYMFTRHIYVYDHNPLSTNFYMAKTDEQFDSIISHYKAFRDANYMKSMGQSMFHQIHRAGVQGILKKLSFEDIFSRLDKHDLLTHAIIFNEQFRKDFDNVHPQNIIASYAPQIISDVKNTQIFDLMKAAVNIRPHGLGDDYNFLLNSKHLDIITTEKVRGIVALKSSSALEPGADNISISLFYGQGAVKGLLTTLKPINEIIKDGFDFSPYNEKPLLGTLKVTDDNFRQARKQIMDQYLKELQEKQANDLLNAPKKPDNSVISQLTKKIEEDAKTNETKPAEPIEPIKVTQKSQLKLF